MRSLAAFSACVVLTCGAGWACFHTAMGAVVTSHLRLDPADAPQQDQNLLLLGLDSRLDEEGHPLPQEMYDALHAGDDSAGGYNANVLIVVHIPKSGAITAVSVPRDDYVDVPGCPEGQCQAKVKQAYGLAYAQALDNIPATADVDTATREQSARDAGRRAEVDTVQNVLGVHLDHFVEVTLAGFFQVAALTQPITVCLNADTSDDYSGANFRQGVQDLSAAQAVAFVRQRRDDNDGSFTDLDRTRRQQAFLVSLLGAVRRGHGMTDPVNLARLLDIAHRDMAVDAGFDLGEFVTQAAHLVDRPISLYTLPITDFGQDAQGSDINLVDVATLRRLVADRFGTADTSDTAHTADGSAPAAGPDVVAATGPGPSAPTPTQLSRMDATSATACVK
ncbi:LCP family protein [Mycolicibacterium sp. J2]|uniref:LCP family protein n=1 Tax=Mycolicibacterium sp. J2 TaxID=2993511 RepID=UPI00224B4154|nr:LCP family protein [Mycolicibacterium sp. J2]MCX2714372.1 LCP family protein [Mycolicibacterium sp. J2]